jgi:hypothetical protein
MQSTLGGRVSWRCDSSGLLDYPRPELFSVIPKGDHIKPEKQKGRP